MMDIKHIIEANRLEADRDFLNLWEIMFSVLNELKLKNPVDVRRYTLEVVRGLMLRGVYPGDYTLESLQTVGFMFWPGTPDELLKRVETEWIALGKTPTLAEPVCWFALRPAQAPASSRTES